MNHAAPHGGEMGMGRELNIEIVSERPAQYRIYLSDPDGKPIPTTGNQIEVAIIDVTGKKLSTLPTSAMGDQYFVAAGEQTNSAKTSVRVTVVLKGKTQPVEMDFTVESKLVSTPTPIVRAAPTSPTVGVEGSGPPGRLPAVHWSDTQNGLTAKMYINPFPLRLGIASEFVLLLTNSEGQAVTNANVEMTLIGGMAGMEGEHDEEFNLKMTSQGAGLYSIRASPGSSTLVFGGMSLRIQRDTRVWTITIPKDALGSR